MSDALSDAEIGRVIALHPKGYDFPDDCMECGDPWPCDAFKVATELLAAEGQLAQAEARKAEAPNRKGALSTSRMQEIAAEHWAADRYHEFWLATEVIEERERAEVAEVRLAQAEARYHRAQIDILQSVQTGGTWACHGCGDGWELEDLQCPNCATGYRKRAESARDQLAQAKARVRHLEQMYDDWRTDYGREKKRAEAAEGQLARFIQQRDMDTDWTTEAMRQEQRAVAAEASCAALREAMGRHLRSLMASSQLTAMGQRWCYEAIDILAQPSPGAGLLEERDRLRAELTEASAIIDIGDRNNERIEIENAAMLERVRLLEAVAGAAKALENESMDEDTGRWMTVPMRYWNALVDANDELAGDVSSIL